MDEFSSSIEQQANKVLNWAISVLRRDGTHILREMMGYLCQEGVKREWTLFGRNSGSMFRWVQSDPELPGLGDSQLLQILHPQLQVFINVDVCMGIGYVPRLIKVKGTDKDIKLMVNIIGGNSEWKGSAIRYGLHYPPDSVEHAIFDDLVELARKTTSRTRTFQFQPNLFNCPEMKGIGNGGGRKTP